MSIETTRLHTFIGQQIAIARKSLGMTQEDLSKKLGLKDRQILSNIEKGHRKIQDNELLTIMKELKRPLDYFTDIYQLPDDQLFAWRAKTPDTEKISLDQIVQESELVARGVVAANKRFSEITKHRLTPIIPRLAISAKSSFKNVSETAEFLSSYWKMGDIPAKELWGIVRDKLKIDVFYLDIADEVSGSSLSTEEFCAIFINRTHPEGRRNFSLAHELFHILTWNTFHPAYFSPEEWEMVQKRSERFADNFASALLMPSNIILPLWKKFDSNNNNLKRWIEDTAEGLLVSPDALFWRLVNLNILNKKNKPIDLHAPHRDESAITPRPYSEQFVKMMWTVLKDGTVSARKCANTLNCTYRNLYDVFDDYNLPAPFNL